MDDALFDPVRLAKKDRLESDAASDIQASDIAVLHDRWRVSQLTQGTPPLQVSATGRIWARRNMGRTVFLDLRDHTGQIQLYLAKKHLPDAYWGLLEQLDLGDILHASGELILSKSGELSIQVTRLQVVAKSLLPLNIGKEFEASAAGRDGILQRRIRHRAAELKYRHPYQHWILDDQARARIQHRSRIIRGLHQYLEREEFMAVDTPILEPVPGADEAEPFSTQVAALGDQPAYLRAAPELYLKRYTVGGFPKVYTLGPCFRNEGMDRTHNPEFTMLEWYEANTGFREQIQRCIDLIQTACRSIHPALKVDYQGDSLDFSGPWHQCTIVEAIQEHAGVDVEGMSAAQIQAELADRGVPIAEGLSWGALVMEMFERTVQLHLIQPTVVTGFPADVSPLAKVDSRDPRLAERFEVYVAGMELANGCSEETDPVLLAERLGDSVDPGFIRAFACGMPPTGGVGVGIDRLVMLLTDAAAIRDVIPFPMMRTRK